MKKLTVKRDARCRICDRFSHSCRCLAADREKARYDTDMRNY